MKVVECGYLFRTENRAIAGVEFERGERVVFLLCLYERIYWRNFSMRDLSELPFPVLHVHNVQWLSMGHVM